MPKTIDITELILRDAHQSLMATRMAMEEVASHLVDWGYGPPPQPEPSPEGAPEEPPAAEVH